MEVDKEVIGVTTLEDLPVDVRLSLTRGYDATLRARGIDDQWMIEGGRSAATDFVADERAFSDGQRLADAMFMLLSADLADYDRDLRSYGEVADDLNARYGERLVVGSDELGPGGPDPGLRR